MRPTFNHGFLTDGEGIKPFQDIFKVQSINLAKASS
jgi:hypothetical protein